jgi:hypothetical protein
LSKGGRSKSQGKRFDILSQDDFIPFFEILFVLQFNSGIPLSMPVLEENPEMFPSPGEESNILEHKEELDHSPKKLVYSLGVFTRKKLNNKMKNEKKKRKM